MLRGIGPGGIRPTDGGADCSRIAPIERVDLTTDFRRQHVFVNPGLLRISVMIDHQIHRFLNIGEAPAVFIIRPGITEVGGGMNQQAFQCAGSHRRIKKPLVLIDHQCGRTGHRGRSHAGAGGTPIRSIAQVRGRVNIHTVPDQIRLDPSIVGGSCRRKSAQYRLCRIPHARSHRILDRANREHVFANRLRHDGVETIAIDPVPERMDGWIVGNGTIADPCHAVARTRIIPTVITRRPNGKKVRGIVDNRILRLRKFRILAKVVVGTVLVRAIAKPPVTTPARKHTIAVIRDVYSGVELIRSVGGTLDHFRIIVLPIVGVDAGIKSHTPGPRIEASRRDRARHVGRVEITRRPIHRDHPAPRELLVRSAGGTNVPEAYSQSATIKFIG